MTLRIATFNLENLGAKPGHSRDGTVPLEARIAILRPQLERLDADILCLQEVNGSARAKGEPRGLPALDALLADTGYASHGRAFTGQDTPKGAHDVHNLVVLSRFPIVHAREMHHALMPPPAHRFLTVDTSDAEPEPVRWDRPLLHVRVALPTGQSLDVINLHLRSPLAAFVPGQKIGPFSWKSASGWAEGFYLAAVKRAGQALETRLLIESLFDADPDALIAVCGDCNAEARETAMRLLIADESDTGNGALAVRELVAVERSVPEDLRYTVLHNGRKTMLDHLLVSKMLMAWYRRAEIHNESLGDELVAYANIGDSPESFHAPVVAEFALPG